ncbi:MAG: SDR family oxidoreductase [Actinobacteria bacterium]|nr:SDR family oxidoreductase [Actinomycetota bacterium]
MTAARGGTGRFEGRVALVTGAAAGQGAATARRLIAEGADVILGDIEEGRQVRRRTDAEATVVFDVCEEDGWQRFVAAALDRHGRIDVLINNAGAYEPRPLEETGTELAMRLFRTNQLGPMLGMAAVAPVMRRTGGGSIVNISSTAGLLGAAGIAAYSATKWALRGLSKVAAAELADDGIRVNCVLPGLIDTAMAGLNRPAFNRAQIARTPLRRIGAAEEVVAATCFLASDESSYVTGAELVVDGGATVG